MFPTFEADFNFAFQVMKREVNTIGKKKKIKMLKTKENRMNKLILIEMIE